MLEIKNTQDNIVISSSQELLQKSFSLNSKKKIKIQNQLDFKYLLLSFDSQTDISFDVLWNNIKWDIYAIYFGSNPIKSDIQVNILSSNCNIKIYMVSFLTSDQQFNINWNIYLWKNIVNSQWHLLEKSIVLGEKIKIKAVPRLDVYSNDVQATHWLSIDRINTDEMFYLNSKWLDENISKEIIIGWNIKKILDQFKDLSDIQKDEIENQIIDNSF